MPHVGNDNEPLLSRAMYVYTGSLWLPALAASNGSLQVQTASGVYVDTVTEQIIVNPALAGGNLINGTACPSGEVWTIEAIEAVDTSNNPTQVNIIATVDSVLLTLVVDATPAANVSTLWQGLITLKQGDIVSSIIAGATAGDVLVLNYHGFKTDIGLT